MEIRKTPVRLDFGSQNHFGIIKPPTAQDLAALGRLVEITGATAEDAGKVSGIDETAPGVVLDGLGSALIGGGGGDLSASMVELRQCIALRFLLGPGLALGSLPFLTQMWIGGRTVSEGGLDYGMCNGRSVDVYYWN